MRSHLVRMVVGSISVALLVTASAVLYANCGACGGDKKAESATHTHAGVKCEGCAEARQGQLCVHCTSHKLELSDADTKKLEAVLVEYNKKVEAAQAELLAKAKASLGEAKAKKLAAAFKKEPKKDAAKK